MEDHLHAVTWPQLTVAANSNAVKAVLLVCLHAVTLPRSAVAAGLSVMLTVLSQLCICESLSACSCIV